MKMTNVDQSLQKNNRDIMPNNKELKNKYDAQLLVQVVLV